MCSMAAAEPKPSLVERLFAEHRAALQAFFRRRIPAHEMTGRLNSTPPARVRRHYHAENGQARLHARLHRRTLKGRTPPV